MTKLTFFLFILLSLMLISSCQNNKDRTHKARQFLSDIASVNADINKYGGPFDKYNNILTQEFKENDRAPLQKQQIDSFNLLYHSYMKSIDQGIQKISGLQEFDTTYKVAAINLLFLEHQRRFWKDMGSQFLKMYKTGWYNLSAEDQNTFAQTVTALKEDQALTHILTDSVTVVSEKFSRKHGFEYKPK